MPVKYEHIEILYIWIRKRKEGSQYSENQREEKSKRTFEIGKNEKSLQKSKEIVRKVENKKDGEKWKQSGEIVKNVEN